LSRLAQTKVVIVDRHLLFAESFGAMLEVRNFDCRSLGVADSPEGRRHLMQQLIEGAADVVVVAADLGPHWNVLSITRGLVRKGISVVVMTEKASDGEAGRALAHGASAVVSKNEPIVHLLAAVRRAGDGKAVLSRADRDHLIAAYRRQDATLRRRHERLGTLSGREAQILRNLMAGHTVREIAVGGCVSESTVRTQVKSILGKLETSSQLTAVALAHAGNWEPLAMA
jgi:two-component system, NarL family, nitrate/nitrite response regulator NarL